ncbi:TIM barrel protein [Mumia qirimensis]|uniref:TIM barrel protein n=1 Tax=Mumia qirimensis TaxID=3234852 RepID=UPI00351D0F49
MPQLTISTACLSGTLEDKLGAASAAGFTGVELLASDLVLSPRSPAEVRSDATDLGLNVEAYQPLHIEAVPDTLHEAQLTRAERTFDVVRALGAELLLLCSTTSPAGLDDDDVAAQQLHTLAERAALRGVRLAYEAVPWGRVATLEHAWRLVRAADHPNLGLCLDSFHALSRANDPDLIGSVPVSKIFHVQLSDAPRPNLTERDWSLHHRTFPGQGALDLVGLVRRLSTMGYEGPLALEVFNDVYQQEDPRYAAIAAMRSMLAFAEAVDATGSAEGRLFGDLLPAAPASSGFAFVELAVDEDSCPLMEATLEALGFAHTAQHRSKPVQLWQQGSSRLLLNHAAHRSIEPASAAVCALGIESVDPAVSAARAKQLLAPRLHRLRRADETELDCVAAPDGTAMFFCDSTGEESWLADFEPNGGSPAPAVRLRAIDHVTLTESIDDFDHTALFYRSVLGLVADRSTEVTAPFGLVRSWSASDPSRRLRLGLSTAPLRRGDWAPMVSSPQHIAFATDDALDCATALRASNVPILEMPDNYYDDLAARADLPAELLEKMREHSVLYDRDEGGAFLHFFTEMIGTRVFFEIVQRIGDYAALGGATSTSLRVTAHHRRRLRVLAPEPAEPDGTHRHPYSIAHLTALSLSPPELVDAAAAAGYQYVGLRLTKVTMEEPYYPLTYDPALMRATKTHLAATGVEVLDVELARLTSGDEPRDFVRFLEAGAELGARHVITQFPDADFNRKVDRFAELCELARPLGLTIDLEFPSWTETGNLTEATRILRAADQSNAGMLIDLLHFARSRSSVSDLAALPREWFHFVHLCDAPAEIPETTEELIHTARFERMFPGEGGIDVHGILAALPQDIPYALEIPRAKLVAQVGAKEHARLAVNAARRHLTSAEKAEVRAQ